MSLLLLGMTHPLCSARAQVVVANRSAIVLNGITAILGDKLALFKVTLAEGARPVSFMLAEGQSRYGLQLVAVDVRSGAVTIHVADQTQVVSICSTPELPEVQPGDDACANSISDSAGTYDAFGRLIVSAAGSGGDDPASGSDLYAGSAASAGKNRDDVADANSVTDSNGTTDSPSPTNSLVYQWWVKEAQKIENARQETAQRVLAGEWEPYPLTPLTPAGTPAALIGEKSLFVNHGPGMIFAAQ